jgi:hypothetical protein
MVISSLISSVLILIDFNPIGLNKIMSSMAELCNPRVSRKISINKAMVKELKRILNLSSPGGMVRGNNR